MMLPLNISFYIPAYNCAGTIQEAVESIMQGNFSPEDELMIVNDNSTDQTETVLEQLKAKYPEIQIIKHSRNKGGGTARNTAIERSRHPLLFNLDSDDILAPGSVPKLKELMEQTGADVAYFREARFFTYDDKEDITHSWKFPEQVSLADYLAGVALGACGNYLFTKESWLRAGGYPEFTGALDTWGFCFRQLATGSKMYGLADGFYYHRHGHSSYWRRDARDREALMSLRAIQLLIPFFDLLNEEDIDYIMSREGRYTWLGNLSNRPIRLRSEPEERRQVWTVAEANNSPGARLMRRLRLSPPFRRLRRWLKAKGVSI